ncbi:helix-hairpin-helix domain-containing protein [Microbacterium sp. Sa4CUA7]|uniref:Helix-hairpin-helix domain-containing protein n=1 Tax=Microbacterium pullorum TaxID=2762236 RepID=A0ABR8S5E3_9MICO|nr:helix-hairpin-helix domain-containing protein [Microbacterium pullorum]
MTVVVIAALAVTVAVGILRTTTAPVETITISETDAALAASPAAAPVYVHVSGAVTTPGLYRLDEGARVVDAVSAAGGFGDAADEAAVNLARVISDGEQLHVPVIGEAPPPELAPGAGGPGTAPGGKVNLNSADIATLDTLPRIGPAMAQRIIDWRDENGRFTSVDDLLAVPGIGDKMLAALRELVTV